MYRKSMLLDLMNEVDISIYEDSIKDAIRGGDTSISYNITTDRNNRHSSQMNMLQALSMKESGWTVEISPNGNKYVVSGWDTLTHQVANVTGN